MSVITNPMLFRASQLMNAYPYDRAAKRDEDIITKAAISQAIVEQTNPAIIAASSFTDRYTLISQIQAGILTTHPAPDELPYQPINEAVIEDKIAAIAKVSETLRLSDRYMNLMLSASENTAQNIAMQVSAIKRLLQWGRYSDAHKVSYCSDFHTQFMAHLRNAFKGISINIEFENAAQPVGLHSQLVEPSMSRNGKEAHFIYGWALTNIYAPVAAYQIFLNTHQEAMLGTPEDATELTAHESGHIGEGIVAYLYGKDPDIIPEELKKDAALLHAMNKEDAYISPRLSSVYASQACEIVALAVGQRARGIIEDALNEVTLKNMSFFVSRTRSNLKHDVPRQSKPTLPAL